MSVVAYYLLHNGDATPPSLRPIFVAFLNLTLRRKHAERAARRYRYVQPRYLTSILSPGHILKHQCHYGNLRIRPNQFNARENSHSLNIMSMVYKKSIAAVDKLVPNKLRPLWQHPAGEFYELLNELRDRIRDFVFRSENNFLLGTRIQMGK